jgi:hypothetical protein
MTGLAGLKQAHAGLAGVGSDHLRRAASTVLPLPVAAELRGTRGIEPVRSYVRAAPENLLAAQRLAGNAATAQLVLALREPAPESPHPPVTSGGARPRGGPAMGEHPAARLPPDPAVVQRFTAELDGERVYLRPERGDTDRDLDATLCVAATDRKIAGRDRIDVTSCLPPRSVAAMSLGPYNCAEYVRMAMGQKPGASGKDLTWFDTPQLWDELRGKGMTVTSLRVLQESGEVEPAEGLSWSDLTPRTGDIVFMNGQIRPRSGQEPHQSGDNFSVSWDHVGIFIVRSRAGRDFHLAKDGDENTTGLYQTGSGPGEFSSPGAYVKGVSSLVAYLGTAPTGSATGPPRQQESVIYTPGEQSARFWALPQQERDRVVAEVDASFAAETGVSRALNWESPQDRALARQWLELRDRMLSEQPDPGAAGD